MHKQINRSNASIFLLTCPSITLSSFSLSPQMHPIFPHQHHPAMNVWDTERPHYAAALTLTTSYLELRTQKPNIWSFPSVCWSSHPPPRSTLGFSPQWLTEDRKGWVETCNPLLVQTEEEKWTGGVEMAGDMWDVSSLASSSSYCSTTPTDTGVGLGGAE